MNNTDSIGTFAYDVLGDTEAFPFIRERFGKHRDICREKWPDLYAEYLETPTLPNLVFLGERLAVRDNAVFDQDSDNTAAAAKLVFGIAVTDFSESVTADFIISESVEELDGCGIITSLQFFAVKVFVPYLSLLSDAVELTANTFISDFEQAFLCGSLTDNESSISAEGQHHE